MTGDFEAMAGRRALRRARRWSVRVAIGAVLAVCAPAAADAAVFNVTGTADSLAACTGAGPFTCPSLRSAVIASNIADGNNTINLPPGTFTLSIGPSGSDDASSGDLNVAANVTINGAGPGAGGTKIVGNGDRVFDIIATTATLSGVAITNGSQQLNGAAIEDLGSSLTLTNDFFAANTTSPRGFGGAVSMTSTGTAALTITNSTFSANIAADTGIDGGGFGGAIYFGSSGGALTITNSTFAANVAQGGTQDQGGFGGAISFEPSGPASLTVTGSTFNDNTAAGGTVSQGGFGGGIDFEPTGAPPHTLTITNSTFFGNRAGGPSGFGGAIDYEPAGGASASLTHVTIVGNAVNKAGQGGGLDIEDTPMTIRNSIVSGNTGAGSPDNCAPSGAGSVVRSGHNIEQGTTCGFDINANPLLGPLASNGGPTQTMALLKGSPAIDKADPAFCPHTDQRGVARPDQPGTACDIGAYEFVAPKPPPLVPPRHTRIYKLKISKKKHHATFWFKASGTVKGFQCELRRYLPKKHAFGKAVFVQCSSPKSYGHLKRGRYMFEVRAYNASGPDKTPATKTFKI